MSNRFIILHTNDIHGRVDGLARIATLIEQIRAENPDAGVLYVDAGDVEATSSRLSNVTKGAAMHRLLRVAGCNAATPGNSTLLPYGIEPLQAYADAADYPLVLANVRLENGNPLPGVETRHIINVNDTIIGLIGITAEYTAYKDFFGLTMPDARHVVRDLAASLWQDGVDLVILISHMGLQADEQLAVKLQDVVNLIIGGHSHDLLPEGKRIGNVWIVQAGQFAEHLGRVDLVWNDDGDLVIERASVIPVDESIEPSPRMLAEMQAIEAEIEAFMSEVIAELAHPLDYAIDTECGVGNLAADALRHFMRADVGLCVVGQAFSGPMPGGRIKRLDLWDVCPSPANPGVVALTGAQLRDLIQKGLDPEVATDNSLSALHDRARGMIHLSGITIRDGQLWLGKEPVQDAKAYQVAASDFELLPNFGYTQADWNLSPTFAAPTIIREAVEAYFLECEGPIDVAMGRIDGSLA